MHPWEVLVRLLGSQGLMPGPGSCVGVEEGQLSSLLLSQPPHPPTLSLELFRHLPGASTALGTKIQQHTQFRPGVARRQP